LTPLGVPDCAARQGKAALCTVTDPLRKLSTDELFGELRRRRPQFSDEVAIRQLRIHREPTKSPADLRVSALWLLAALTGVLLVVIAVLAIQGKDIPDLLSGLAGSGIGAIAGILSGGGDRDRPHGTSPPES
jgi:hypothetical protein